MDETKKKYNLDILNVPPEFHTVQNKEVLKYRPEDIDAASTVAIFKALKAFSPVPATITITKKLKAPNDNLDLGSVIYKLDQHRRRVVDYQKRKKKAENFILALGDSFTFGLEVTNGHDYPSQLARKINNNYQIYNLGVPAYGSNDTLQQIRINQDFLNGITQKKGMALWFFIPEQLNRFFCPLNCYLSQSEYFSYIKYKPYFRLENDKLVFKGYFRDLFDPYHLFLELLSHSRFLKYIHFSNETTFTNNEIKSFALSFSAISKRINNKLKLEKFYFILKDDFPQKSQFITALENEGISVLDFSEIPFNQNLNSTIYLDIHPTSDFYWLFTEVLKNKLNL